MTFQGYDPKWAEWGYSEEAWESAFRHDALVVVKIREEWAKEAAKRAAREALNARLAKLMDACWCD